MEEIKFLGSCIEGISAYVSSSFSILYSLHSVIISQHSDGREETRENKVLLREHLSALRFLREIVNIILKKTEISAKPVRSYGHIYSTSLF